MQQIFHHYLLKRKHFSKIEVTKSSGDQGVDIIACKHRKKYGIQCKYYTYPVGNKAVQEAYAGANFYDCDKVIVMTNTTFTRSAIELAEKLERTDEEIIAECAVKDRIWGIGLSMEDENRRCIDKWRGQNLLGKILMQVREDIRHQNRVTQAFRNVEKAFSGVAEDAGFHAESELRDYAERIRQKKE